MAGQFRQSLFGRVGGYEDVNDAERPVRENSTPPPHLLEGCEGEQNRCGPSHIRIMINTVGIGESGYRWLLSVRLRH